MLGIRTRDRRMVSTDDSPPPNFTHYWLENYPKYVSRVVNRISFWNKIGHHGIFIKLWRHFLRSNCHCFYEDIFFYLINKLSGYRCCMKIRSVSVMVPIASMHTFLNVNTAISILLARIEPGSSKIRTVHNSSNLTRLQNSLILANLLSTGPVLKHYANIWRRFLIMDSSPPLLQTKEWK